MLVFPLGLGTKWRRLPVVTLGVGLLWILVFIFDRSDDHIFRKIVNSVAETGVRDRARKLFVDYCQSRHGAKERCERYAVLVWTGYPGAKAPAASRPKAPPPTGDEFERAEKVREQLAACDDDKLCFVYKDIVWRFLDQGHLKTDALTRLASYGGYLQALTAYRQRLKTICAESACLVKNNINLTSLVAAESRHGGFLHLVSNLFVFLMFGAYAEQRAGRLFYAAVIAIGGTLGMAVHAAYFSSGDTIALGGSANVAAAMGLFFVFFFRRNMRILVWVPRKIYFGSTFAAPVALAFPLVFLLADVVGGFDPGFGALTTGNVAHFAHLGGFAFGALAGAIFIRLSPLPDPLLYADELRDLSDLKADRSLASVFAKAGAMIRVNPDNVFALEAGVDAFLRWTTVLKPNENAALFDRGRQFLSDHLATVCALGGRNDRMVAALRLLSRMPMFLAYPSYLGRLGPDATLTLADFAVLQGHPVLAMRLYDLFLANHPQAADAPKVLATVAATLTLMPGTKETAEALAAFALHHPTSALLPGISLWQAERRSA